MKVHLKQIPLEGLHLQGEEDCPIKEQEAEEVHCAGPLSYNLALGVSNGALWAHGTLEQPVKLRCVSCLETFAHKIQVPAFSVHIELPGPEMVDLTPSIREDLLLNLPAHPRCDRDGDQICKAKLLEGPQQDTKRKLDWSALDKLKLEN